MLFVDQWRLNEGQRGLQRVEVDARAHVHSSPKIDDLDLPAGCDQHIIRLYLHIPYTLRDHEARSQAAKSIDGF